MMRAKTISIPAFTLLFAARLAAAATCSQLKDVGEQVACPGPGCHGVTLAGRHMSAMEKIALAATNEAAAGEVSVFESQIVGNEVIPLVQKPSQRFEQEDRALASLPTIEVNPDKKFQTMYGFGAALTEACVMHINRLPDKMRKEFLKNTFGPDGGNFNLIRLPMGSTDFADPVKGNYTYDETKNNKPDLTFKNLDMSRDEKSFAIIREARKINPNLKVMITPWSAPAWMKTEGQINGGELKPEYRQVYADYFVRVIKEYEKRGIPVDSLTIQNEPAYASLGVPSMGVKPVEQGEFIRDYLGPTLEKNKLEKKIYGHDHNWSQSERDADPISAVPGVKKYMKGIAYHCYGGEKWGMWDTVNHHPDLELFQTECSGSDAGYSHSGDFHWWLDTQSVGAVNMGTTGAIAWNLCLDEKHGPVNWGKDYSGCTNCRGLVAMDFSGKNPKVTYNPEFHALSQVSRFIVPGTKRIELAGKTEGTIQSVAFQRPDGGIVLVAENLKNEPVKFRAQTPDCRQIVYDLPAQGAATFVWGAKLKAEGATKIKSN
jgi:glucosylceramidase